MKFLFIAILFLVPTALFGAEAAVKTEFTVNAPFQKTVNFIDRNQQQLRNAAGLEVLENLGEGKIKVRRDTPKGVFIWVMTEEIEEKDGLYRYKSKLVESIQGGIEQSDTDIILQTNRDHVTVSVSIHAVVNNRRIRNIDLSIDLKRRIRRVEQLLQANLEQDYPNLIPQE